MKNLSNSSPEGDIFGSFKFSIPKHRPKFESSVHQEITSRIITSEKLPEIIPDLPSSTIEDFIMGEIGRKSDLTAEYEAQGVNAKAENVVMLAETITQNQNVVLLISNLVNDIKRSLENNMSNVGFSNEQIHTIINNTIFFETENDRSYSLENGVSINCPQVVRKALDYQVIFNSANLIDIVMAELINTTGHELGHKIRDLYSFDIPYEWGDPESENTKERFAESWGRVLLNPHQATIVKRNRALQTAKVNQIWQKCKHHNFDLIKALKDIQDISSKKISVLLEARLSLYNGSEPENYALPYNMGQIMKQLQKS